MTKWNFNKLEIQKYITKRLWVSNNLLYSKILSRQIVNGGITKKLDQ